MRATLLLLAVSLVLSASAGAVKLETAATVALVAPARTQLDHWTDDAQPAWTVTGAPAEQLQVSLELRTADGRRISLDRAAPLVLDQTGRALTTVDPGSAAPDDAIDVVTLVVCRQ